MTTPADNLRDRIAAALTSVWYQRAAEQTPAAPEEHCAALAAAVLSVLPDAARQVLGTPTTAPASVPAAPADRATALTDAERTMLTYALDQAQERIWAEDGFTDEDQAAVTSLRRLADEAQPTETEAPATLAALMATIQDLHALQQPLIDGLRFIREDMDRAGKGGDEWATEWMGQVWMELPLQVRAAGGDTDAAQELADAARRTEPAAAEAKERREPHPTEADLAHALNLLNQLPATTETEDDDTLHTCPGRWGGPDCRCFDPEPATAATEEPQP